MSKQGWKRCGGIAGIGTMLYQRKCPVCGKDFLMTEGWVYRFTGLKGENFCLCSWKCFRVAEAMNESKKQKPRLHC
jgi:hypothetical protein